MASKLFNASNTQIGYRKIDNESYAIRLSGDFVSSALDIGLELTEDGKKKLFREILISKKEYTSQELKQATYGVYLYFVKFIDKELSVVEFILVASQLFWSFGIILTPENIARVLTLRLASYGKCKGQDEKAKKVLSIGSFRKLLTSHDFADIDNASLHFATPKNPAEHKETMKEKCARLELELAQMKAEKANKEQTK